MKDWLRYHWIMLWTGWLLRVSRFKKITKAILTGRVKIRIKREP
jgi:hypothetical protein